MSNPLVIDCAWSRPSGTAVRAAGYIGVIGYVSPDKSKNITPANIDDYHANGLFVGLVWENGAGDALYPQLGGPDAAEAVRQAENLGYPLGAALYMAVDTDTSAAAVLGYFINAKPIILGGGYQLGVYGGIHITDPLMAEGVCSHGWQACAWSSGVVSNIAQLYQRLAPTLAPIGGIGADGYDEDVILRPGQAGLWYPGAQRPVQTPPPNTTNTGPPFGGRDLSYPPLTSGADVKTWQARMAARGWSITIDGYYGPASSYICRQFQAQKQLSVDGVVGPQTWSAAWALPVTP